MRMLRPFRRSAFRRPASARLAPSQTAALFKGHLGRLVGDGAALPHADELRVRAGALDAEDLVTDSELGDRCADRLDLSGQLHPEGPPRWSPKAGEEANDERARATHAAVGAVDRRGVDLHEDFVVPGHRPLDFFESQDLRRPVPVVDYGSHGWTQLTLMTTLARA